LKIINSKLALHKSEYMKTKTIIYTFLLLLVLTVQRCQCKKDDTIPKPMPTPQPIPCDTCLPAITTTGQNTFGCRVNGKVWLPQNGSFQPGVNADLLGNQIGIQGFNNSRNEFVTICLNPIYDTCYYKFPTNLLIKQQGQFLELHKDYIADTISSGFIHFTRVDFMQGVFSAHLLLIPIHTIKTILYTLLTDDLIFINNFFKP